MSEFDPAKTKLTLYANNERWGDSNYYWQFRNGDYQLSIKALDFPEYDAARDEFNRRVQEYLGAPVWRRGLMDALFFAAPLSPKMEPVNHMYFDPVDFNDDDQTVLIRLRKMR